MTRRPGRPRTHSTKVRLVLSLRPGEHDDLIAWFQEHPPGSDARCDQVLDLLSRGLTIVQLRRSFELGAYQ